MTDKKRKQIHRMLYKELGPNWRTELRMLGTEDLCQRAGKSLTSFVAYPERGEGFSEPH